MAYKSRAVKRAELVAENAVRVDKAVAVFLRQNPEFKHLEDDMKSEGTLRLVDSVNRFLTGKVVSLPAYLRLSIWSGLWEVARTDDVIQTPRNCPARQTYEKELTSYEGKPEPADLDGEERLLRVCCVDEVDRMLVSMIRSGRTVRQMAKELIVPLSEVRERKKNIADRLVELT